MSLLSFIFNSKGLAQAYIQGFVEACRFPTTGLVFRFAEAGYAAGRVNPASSPAFWSLCHGSVCQGVSSLWSQCGSRRGRGQQQPFSGISTQRCMLETPPAGPARAKPASASGSPRFRNAACVFAEQEHLDIRVRSEND